MKVKYIEKLPIEALIPMIEVFKDYFDKKYPCDTDSSCGDNMPIEDFWKERIYNKLLSIYNADKNKYDIEQVYFYHSLKNKK